MAPFDSSGVKGVEHDPLPELVVARGVLAEAGEIAADRPEPGQVLLHDAEIGVERRDHGLHERDAAFAGDGDHLSRLAGIGGQGLLAQHVLAVAHAEDALRSVQEIGRGDVNGVDERARGHLFEQGEGVRDAVLRSEGVGPLLRTRQIATASKHASCRAPASTQSAMNPVPTMPNRIFPGFPYLPVMRSTAAATSAYSFGRSTPATRRFSTTMRPSTITVSTSDALPQ